MSSAATAAPRKGLTAHVQRSARRWARRRQGSDPGEITLGQRRIYILPTRQCLGFALMLVVMALGSMNYNNNLGLALTFWLMGVLIVSMHRCHANLNNLQVRPARIPSVFAGEVSTIAVHIENPSKRPRYGLRLNFAGKETIAVDVPAQSSAVLEFDYTTIRRGEHRIGSVTLSSRYPLTLFRAWTYLFFDWKILVYPRPAPKPPPLPEAISEEAGPRSRPRLGDADFMGMREYRPGDPMKRIAWKASARRDEFLVKEFAETATKTRWLEWDATNGSVEQRLSVMCAWVLENMRSGYQFGMRLPHRDVQLGRGEHHGTRCLKILAR